MLNVVHANYVRKGEIPNDAQIEKLMDRIFKLRYATTVISDRMKNKAMEIVKNYVALHKGEFRRILETEKRFEFALNDALISGQIDLLKKVDEKGAVTEVEIIDFKTDRNDSVYSADYEKQLRFYAIACLESLGLKPERAYVHHLSENVTSEVDISQANLDTVKQEVGKEVSAILKKQFPPRPSAKICSECDYKVICSFKNTTGHASAS
jgi:DNA helicase-2/ATP-dependent DNA helicase PcrA